MPDEDRPALSLQTVYVHDSDRAETRRLGTDLYHHLTRPADDPLGYGANIPVRVGVAANKVDLEAADVVVLLPVLGKTTFNLECEAALARIRERHKRLGAGHVLPVPTSTNWRSVEGRLPGKQFLMELYEAHDPRRKTIDEVVLAVARLLSAPSGDAAKPLRKNRVSPRLFVLHRADLRATDVPAKRIHDYVVTDSTGRERPHAPPATPRRRGGRVRDRSHATVARHAQSGRYRPARATKPRNLMVKTLPV